MKRIDLRPVAPPLGQPGRRQKTGLRKLLICACTLGIFLSSNLNAQLSFVGGETQVNTTTAHTQEFPALSMDATGNAVVVWQSWANDGDGYGVFGRRFDNAGTAIGGEFSLNATTAGNQESADVAVTANGSSVATWISQGQDGDGWGIYARRFDAAGVAQGGEIQVASTTTGNQKDPRVAVDGNGNFAIVWVDESLDGSEQGVFARRFDASGSALGAAFQVNTYTTDYQGHPDIAMNAGGSFAIAWQSYGQDGDQYGVYFQRYNAAGSTVGAETAAANTTAGNQQSPSLGLDAAGNFVIGWTSYAQDGDNRGVYARRFDANGAALANEFKVNSTTANGQDQPAVMVAGDGNFAISWSSYGQDASFHGVYVQQYDPNGAALGAEKQVNTRTADFQQASAASWPDTSLNLLVVWMDGLDASTATHDGDDYGIYLQGLAVDPPAIQVNAVCQDVTLYLDGSGMATLATSAVDNGSSTNAGSLSLSLSQTSFACADLGQSTVTLTASAGPGNSDTCTATITVLDTLAPVVTCPADMVLTTDPGACEALVTYTGPAAADNCGSASLQLTAGLDSGSLFPVGATSVSWTATDNSGNAASCTFTVTVQELEAPVITCPANITVPTDPGVCGALVTYAAPGASDNCGLGAGGVTLASGLGSGATFPVGTSTETWTVTDLHGNTSNCSFTIAVQDQEAPVINCPFDFTIPSQPGTCSSLAFYVPPLVSDNCGLSASGVTLTSGLGSGAVFPLGTTTETWTATDQSGNTSTCSFNVTVQDQEAPVIACPADITLTNQPGTCSSLAFYFPPTASDNCGLGFPGLSLSSGLGSGNFFPVGTTTETWTATDQSGNTSSCSFNVTVKDVEAPTITCPQDMLLFVTTPVACAAPANFNVPSVGDNCGTPWLNYIGGALPGQWLPPGTHSSVWSATDPSGNTTSCGFNITVIDNQPPVIVCPQPIVIQAPFGWPGYYVNYDPPFVMDGCGAYTFLAGGLPTGSFFPIGTSYITWGAYDAFGNVSYCTFPITVTPSVWWGWGEANPVVNNLEADPISPSTKGGVEAESGEMAPMEAQQLEIMAYPNPFGEQTTIRFRLPEATQVTVEVYSMYGQRVATLFNGEVAGGETKEVDFRPEGIASGIYHYRLTSESGIVQTGKLMYER